MVNPKCLCVRYLVHYVGGNMLLCDTLCSAPIEYIADGLKLGLKPALLTKPFVAPPTFLLHLALSKELKIHIAT